MDQEKEIAQQTVVEDEPKITLAEKLKKRKKLQRKLMTKRGLQFFGGLLFAYILWLGFKPFKASAEYGICYTMLELQIPYPDSLYVSEVNTKRDGSMEMWYTHIDAFGGYRMESLICRVEYFQDPNTNVSTPKVTELRFNKINWDSKRLAYINSAMPYFIANPLIKNYPAALPDSLADLQINSDMFRKIKIDPTKKTR